MAHRFGQIFDAILCLLATLGAASAQVVVSGVVAGYDGKPLAAALVQLTNAANEVIDSAHPAAGGSFKLRAPRPGLFRLRFAAPLHGEKDTWILTEEAESLSINAQLTAPEYLADMSNLRLSTSDPKSPLNGKPFVRQSSGIFVLKLESDAPELLLAVNGLVKNGPPLAIPGYQRYRCLNNQHCYAVAHPVAGSNVIMFDPKLLAISTRPAQIDYGNRASPSTVAALVLNDAEEFNRARRVARQDVALQSGKALNQVQVEIPPTDMVVKVIREIGMQREPLALKARLFEYLLLVYMGTPADRFLVRRALEELTPSSPLWALNFGNVAGAAILASGEPENYVEYAMQIMDAQPSKALKAMQPRE